jgi:hypothetical protein
MFGRKIYDKHHVGKHALVVQKKTEESSHWLAINTSTGSFNVYTPLGQTEEHIGGNIACDRGIPKSVQNGRVIPVDSLRHAPSSEGSKRKQAFRIQLSDSRRANDGTHGAYRSKAP